MNNFPFPASEFAPEAERSPLWKPTPGRPYYLLFDQTVDIHIWNGGSEDTKALDAGQVFKSLPFAASTKRYLSALAKLWRYAALFHIENESHNYRLEPLHGKLVVCNDGRPTILPKFHTPEFARLALERLSEAEHNSLVEGPQWT